MELRARRRAVAGVASIALLGGGLLATSANAAVPHVVQPGETLWSIAAANNLTTRTVAVFNGLSEDAQVVVGETIQVPTVDEGAAALATVPSAEPAADPATGEPAASGSGAGHTVVPGESLSSVAAANGISVDALAAANGIAADSYLQIGQSLSIPAATGSAAASAAPAPGMGTVPSPYGELQLEANAASSWNAMREQSLRDYGQDLYPGGPQSAYRTYEQQAGLYDAYLRGEGAPANPPGTSTHERGLSVDVETPEMRSVVDQIGPLFGWGKLEAPDEWWHVTYGGG